MTPPPTPRKTTIGCMMPVPRLERTGPRRHAANQMSAVEAYYTKMRALWERDPRLPPKSKEIDSGVKLWETPDPPGSYPKMFFSIPTMAAYTPFANHIKDYRKASSMYPANCAVFVGNLPAYYTDTALTVMVLDEFLLYGPCYGYVRRDMNKANIPYAILQYTNELDAATACSMSQRPAHAIYFDNRPARVEASHVPRDLYVYRVDGGPVDKDEVAKGMSLFGVKEQVRKPSTNWIEQANLPPNGVYMVFVTWGAFRAAKTRLAGDKSSKFRFAFGLFRS